jgi:hypothetical protein
VTPFSCSPLAPLLLFNLAFLFSHSVRRQSMMAATSPRAEWAQFCRSASESSGQCRRMIVHL